MFVVFFFWLYLSYCMEEREGGVFEDFLSAKELSECFHCGFHGLEVYCIRTVQVYPLTAFSIKRVYLTPDKTNAKPQAIQPTSSLPISPLQLSSPPSLSLTPRSPLSLLDPNRQFKSPPSDNNHTFYASNSNSKTHSARSACSGSCRTGSR